MNNKEYIVVEIVNNRELIVNYGIKDGAAMGDKVRIYEVGPTILHPETKEELGTYDFIKDYLEVTLCFDYFSICKKIIRKEKNNFLAISALTGGTTREVGEISVDENDFTNRKKDFSHIIKPGDKVKIIKWLTVEKFTLIIEA